MINLDIPKKFKPLVRQAQEVASEVLRPISRKYDRAEHERPVELDMLAAVIDGMNEGNSEVGGTGATGVRRDANANDGVNRNGTNMSTALSIMELCWGDVGMLLSMPRQGLGNSAIASVANDEQLARFKGRWAAMAITEPGCGSDSANIRTTARLDGDHYVLNGEKIYVTAGDRADLVVVWATLDRNLGRSAIKSFVVEKGTPGFELARLEHKLGIRASDTAAFILKDCRVPRPTCWATPKCKPKRALPA
jgi:acyl-CoA dehydrogenase